MIHRYVLNFVQFLMTIKPQYRTNIMRGTFRLQSAFKTDFR